MLAPDIYRQRLVIEGFSSEKIDHKLLTNYISYLSSELNMNIVCGPLLHYVEGLGLAGYAHWTTSGIHVYTWENENFVSVDIYTCKPFNEKTATEVTCNLLKLYKHEIRPI